MNLQTSLLLRATTALAALVVCCAATFAQAQSRSVLSGYTFVDRNNDGLLAFDNQPLPEWVIPDVTIELYLVNGNNSTLLQTALTDEFGNYTFNNLSAGIYNLVQVQPIEWINGITSAGTIASLAGMPNPVGTSSGVAGTNQITNIVLDNSSRGTLFNFGELGLAPAYVSKRYLLACAPPPVYANDIEVVVPEPGSVILAVVSLGLGALAVRRATRKSG